MAQSKAVSFQWQLFLRNFIPRLISCNDTSGCLVLLLKYSGVQCIVLCCNWFHLTMVQTNMLRLSGLLHSQELSCSWQITEILFWNMLRLSGLLHSQELSCSWQITEILFWNRGARMLRVSSIFSFLFLLWMCLSAVYDTYTAYPSLHVNWT